MFGEELGKVAESAAAKKKLFAKNPTGYILSSMLGGFYVGIGIMLILTIGSILNAAGSPMVKIAMGLAFGVALSLVTMAGSELFTGNVFVVAVGVLKKSISVIDLLKIWVFSFLGNLLGSILGAYLFAQAGLAKGAVGEFILSVAGAKMAGAPNELFFKGVLCNIMVCLAVWCSFKLKEETAKLIMIFWCLFVFITCGFEHSIANMTLLSIGLFLGGSADVSVMGFVHNLTWVTLGNIIGGLLFVVLPYFIIAKEEKINGTENVNKAI